MKRHPARRPKHSGALFTPEEWRLLAENLDLSGREVQIIQCTCEDLKNAAIASRLGIAVRTVREHFERLYRKCNVGSRAGLIVHVVQSTKPSRNKGRPNSSVKRAKSGAIWTIFMESQFKDL